MILSRGLVSLVFLGLYLRRNQIVLSGPHTSHKRMLEVDRVLSPDRENEGDDLTIVICFHQQSYTHIYVEPCNYFFL